jgi:multiple sugar transport system permease protein
MVKREQIRMWFSILDKILTYLFFLVVLVFFLGPLTWLITAAIHPDPSYTWKLPTHPTLANFTDLFEDEDIVTWMKNSAIISVITMAATVVLATLAAYPLSRVRFPGKFIFMYSLLLARVMPIASVIIPIFSIAIVLDMVNSFLGVILVLTAMQLPISLWIMKGYVDSIPLELEESAWLDGCNRLNGLVRIVFPLMGPGIAVTGLFAFLGAWGDFLVPLVLLRTPDKFPIAIGLFRAFNNQSNVRFGFLTAIAVLYTAPTILLYILARRYLIKGMTAGSVKM